MRRFGLCFGLGAVVLDPFPEGSGVKVYGTTELEVAGYFSFLLINPPFTSSQDVGDVLHAQHVLTHRASYEPPTCLNWLPLVCEFELRTALPSQPIYRMFFLK